MAKRALAVAVVVAILFAGSNPANSQEVPIAPPDQLEGVWQTKLMSEVTIVACPGGFCGSLSKIIVPTEGLSAEEIAAAQTMPVESFTDQRNKDPALRDRPMLGLQILTLRYGKKPNVYDGDIYNPQDGETYSGYLEILAADVVRLNGCVLYNIICQGEDWVRVIPEPTQPTK